MNLFFIVLTHIFFASTFTVTKMALWYGNPFVLVSFRLILGAIFLLCMYVAKYNNWTYLKEQTFWKDVILLSFCMAYIPYVGEYWAMDYLSSIKTVLLYNMSPFITAIMSFILLREKITIKQTIGMIIGFIGSMPLLLETISPIKVFGLLSTLTFGSLPEYVMFGVMMVAALGWIIMQQSQIKRGYPLLLLNGMAMLGGGICAVVHSGIQGYLTPLSTVSVMQSFLFVGYASILTFLSTAGHTLYSYILTGFSATFVSLTGLSIPIFTVIFSSVLLKETLSVPSLVSFFIVSIGLILFYSDEQ